ncbi:bifunctional 4-hydroxy-2-oxoglutarate aldolase/2-dehydro-3-deoxy-phosphogluconate aldolase [Blastococcus sp. PRF04-17]|uniref:bifunctional 4-hydroxy-2-oxoglutarate aldolase/2-dehydro-3-deoxy-phosphogluconate aldolase n=1 Tax=Blastococcus sp. PRF04-17 TaxID=2933797 RepID=UPI001FF4C822|nr:bifunctional 4-hydroxy-2-oxoglutarate aldolase/2-dehydro-3-deoxy-phosphogluconate aldolase [Blastococcus sp. PRF04-17]UOY00126.1 bifunctional 4-hydroxy-2-oxoglutarate aldolase/2-dehydro-3-deoxy-phosphogluconate aldolase [Blastococcus sp. PRF04-17]
MSAQRLQPGRAVRETALVAILRGRSGAHLDVVCDTLLDAGVRCLEITLNTPRALDVVHRLAAEARPGVEVGVGTVRRPEEVDAAADAGASFVVAPTTSAAVGERTAARGLGWYPGALSPTEIATAWELGATAVKVFPAGSAGGPRYLKEVRAPLDDVLLIPTGGVGVDDVPGYLQAGAVAVGMGGPLIGAALDGDDDLAALAGRARAALDAVARGRSGS